MKKGFKPFHLNAKSTDFVGNDDIGRYVFLPGSDGRAKELAVYFSQLQIKKHPRGHNLYLGKLDNIEVAAISTGMGCSSMEIILHELIHLGAKRFLRVGTAGSLQPYVKLGDFINVQAAVRDEQTTQDYAPISVPAIATFDYTQALLNAAQKLEIKIHTGVVHCKSSLYAREFGIGPIKDINRKYIKTLQDCGVLASEMETSALFIQTQIFNQILKLKHPKRALKSAAVLAVVSSEIGKFAESKHSKNISKQLINLSLETIKIFAKDDY